MNVVEAMKLLLEGKKVRMDCWKDKEQYLYLNKEDGLIYNNTNRINEISCLYGEWSIYKESILDDVERVYLSNIIKPFRNNVYHIVKWSNGNTENISISVKNNLNCDIDYDIISLPAFEKGKMYKGMEADTRYSLDTLDL